MKMYAYWVERKSDGKRFVMIGNLKDCNMGGGKYLYDIVGEKYEYARNTPYGYRSNVSTGVKCNSKHYRILHQTVIG